VLRVPAPFRVRRCSTAAAPTLSATNLLRLQHVRQVPPRVPTRNAVVQTERMGINLRADMNVLRWFSRKQAGANLRWNSPEESGAEVQGVSALTQSTHRGKRGRSSIFKQLVDCFLIWLSVGNRLSPTGRCWPGVGGRLLSCPDESIHQARKLLLTAHASVLQR
jgi:hypothetical protein